MICLTFLQAGMSTVNDIVALTVLVFGYERRYSVLLTIAVKFIFSVWTLSHTITSLIQLYAQPVRAFKLIRSTSCTKHINEDSIPLLKARNENAMVTQKPRTWKSGLSLDTLDWIRSPLWGSGAHNLLHFLQLKQLPKQIV